MTAKRFFEYARKRHAIYLRRLAGAPRETWTNDPILQEFRFTNVFRELDKTTAWFAQAVREPMRDQPDVLLATVVFRMLNRIATGEAVFCQYNLRGRTAYEDFRKTRDARVLRSAIRHYVGKKGPYVTGAYIITSPTGYSKLDGVMQILEQFHKKSKWEEWALGPQTTMQEMWERLRDQPFLGNFHSYEIVTDLRHTALLEHATDINTWCNIGPGARRGINRVLGLDKDSRELSGEKILREMSMLLAKSRNKNFWPQTWPGWEMREVEHTLCEFDKYERVRLGEGKPRGVFR